MACPPASRTTTSKPTSAPRTFPSSSPEEWLETGNRCFSLCELKKNHGSQDDLQDFEVLPLDHQGGVTLEAIWWQLMSPLSAIRSCYRCQDQVREMHCNHHIRKCTRPQEQEALRVNCGSNHLDSSKDYRYPNLVQKIDHPPSGPAPTSELLLRSPRPRTHSQLRSHTETRANYLHYHRYLQPALFFLTRSPNSACVPKS